MWSLTLNMNLECDVLKNEIWEYKWLIGGLSYKKQPPFKIMLSWFNSFTTLLKPHNNILSFIILLPHKVTTLQKAGLNFHFVDFFLYLFFLSFSSSFFFFLLFLFLITKSICPLRTQDNSTLSQYIGPLFIPVMCSDRELNQSPLDWNSRALAT